MSICCFTQTRLAAAQAESACHTPDEDAEEPKHKGTVAKRPEILHKSSKELYRAVAAQWGITCKMSDHCRCLDCQVCEVTIRTLDTVDVAQFSFWKTRNIRFQYLTVVQDLYITKQFILQISGHKSRCIIFNFRGSLSPYFTTLSQDEVRSESKERFAIQRYLLIIGKKQNMQVLSHTFAYFST